MPAWGTLEPPAPGRAASELSAQRCWGSPFPEPAPTWGRQRDRRGWLLAGDAARVLHQWVPRQEGTEAAPGSPKLCTRALSQPGCDGRSWRNRLPFLEIRASAPLPPWQWHPCPSSAVCLEQLVHHGSRGAGTSSCSARPASPVAGEGGGRHPWCRRCLSHKLLC